MISKDIFDKSVNEVIEMKFPREADAAVEQRLYHFNNGGGIPYRKIVFLLSGIDYSYVNLPWEEMPSKIQNKVISTFRKVIDKQLNVKRALLKNKNRIYKEIKKMKFGKEVSSHEIEELSEKLSKKCGIKDVSIVELVIKRAVRKSGAIIY